MANYSNFNGGQNGARGRPGSRYRPMAEINVTPFVDVMLVLLVVFMITAPLLSVGVPLDLPETKAKPLTGNAEPLTVSVDKAGKVYLMDKAIGLDDLAPRLTAIATNRGPDMRIFVRGDQNVNYGAVMRVMGILNAAGFRKVALVTTSETKDK
jgi:biopolymer transport protein TolR